MASDIQIDPNTMDKLTKQIEGIDIYVSQSYGSGYMTGYFLADLGDRGGVIAASTLSDLRAQITEAVEADRRRRRSRGATSFTLLNQDGVQDTVTGIHASRHVPLGLKEHTATMYPNVAWVQERLAHRYALLVEAEIIKRGLTPLALKWSHPNIDVFADALAEKQALAESVDRYEDLPVVEKAS